MISTDFSAWVRSVGVVIRVSAQFRRQIAILSSEAKATQAI